MISIRNLDAPLGAEVAGVDVSTPLPQADIAAIENAWRERLVVVKHALRNAAIPILTLIGLQAGQLMGGAVLTETVFAWPGLGRLMVKAIFARDYVLLQGAVLIFAMAFVAINLIVDLSYGALDPRVSRQG